MSALVLASGSVVRRRLLAAAGLAFTVDVADVDETPEGDPFARALALAERKALAVSARNPGALVVGADQVGAVEDGRELAKVWSEDEAVTQLLAMAGRAHAFLSAAVVVRDGAVLARVEQRATVRFRAFDEAFARWYASLHEWRGSAGSYQIENRGALLVDEVQGPLHAVLGLPLFPLLASLGALGCGPNPAGRG